MAAGAAPDITGILRELSEGKRDSFDRLVPLVYEELRRIAREQLKAEKGGHTLSATAVVHEAYLRLVDVRNADWRNRAHFFAMAARLMRRVLIDYARAKGRDKRGGQAIRVPLSAAEELPIAQTDDLLNLDEALTRLAALNERLCQVVECRCVAGLSVEETAATLGTSPATVKRDWALARAWLNRELAANMPGEGAP